jgi:2-oxoglutarate dehydrogenase complex dehydrogenase (E1) component-like enzyme
MYHCINQHPTVVHLYFKQLLQEQHLTIDARNSMVAAIEAELVHEHEYSKTSPSFWDNMGDLHLENAAPSILDSSSGSSSSSDDQTSMSTSSAEISSSSVVFQHNMDTGVERKLLEDIGAQIFRIPTAFTAHKKVLTNISYVHIYHDILIRSSKTIDYRFNPYIHIYMYNTVSTMPHTRCVLYTHCTCMNAFRSAYPSELHYPDPDRSGIVV